MDTFKLDRTAFKWQNREQAAHTLSYWLSLPISERLKATLYLNSVCYGIDINNPERIDKTFFNKRKRNL
jgi:hypothetical protein